MTERHMKTAADMASDILDLEEVISLTINTARAAKHSAETLDIGLDDFVSKLRDEVGKKIAQKYNNEFFPKPKEEEDTNKQTKETV